MLLEGVLEKVGLADPSAAVEEGKGRSWPPPELLELGDLSLAVDQPDHLGAPSGE